MNNKEKLRLIYEHCKVHQPNLIAEIDRVVSQDKALPVPVMEQLGRVLSKAGILHNNCEILESQQISDGFSLRVALLESYKKNKSLYSKNQRVLERYALRVGQKQLIPSCNLRPISEALAYNRSVAESQSLSDLSDLPLSEGSWVIDNYQDFIVNFSDEWVRQYAEELVDLEHWFSNGGVLTLNIYPDENSLTGYNASLGWSDGESTYPGHTKINDLVKQYITKSITDYYVTESSAPDDDQSDDIDMTEYHLDQSLEYGVKYQVIESNVSDLSEFDEIEVIAKEKTIGGKIIIKVNDTDIISISPADYTSVVLVKLADYDVIMEDDMDFDGADMDGGMDFGDINECVDNNLDGEAVPVLLQRCQQSPECVIPIIDSATDYIFWNVESGQWTRYTVDEFGNSALVPVSEFDASYAATLYLLQQADAGVNVEQYEVEPDVNNLLDFELTYSAVRDSGRLSEDELADFTSRWVRIINNADYNKKQKNDELTQLLQNWYLADLAVYKQLSQPVDVELIAAKLHEFNPLIAVEDIYATLTDDDVRRYTEIVNDNTIDDETKELSLQSLLNSMFPYE